MSITATLDYTAAPKAEIIVTSPDTSAITAVTLYRVVGTTKTLTRVQPSTGTASQYVEDYEAPWAQQLTYQAVVTYNSGKSTATYTSAAVTINPGVAWAIHPTTPALSVQLDALDFTTMGIVSLGSVRWAANRTLHTVLNSPYPVPTSTGDRVASSGTLTVSTKTLDEKVALRALLNDQTPILIRIPTQWGWGWDDGYYDIGDVDLDRPLQYGPDPSRTFTLPYQRTTAPAGGQESTWSYQQLTTAFADYPSIHASYADYPAVTANNQG